MRLIATIASILIFATFMYANTTIIDGCVNETLKTDTIMLNLKIEKQKL